MAGASLWSSTETGFSFSSEGEQAGAEFPSTEADASLSSLEASGDSG